MSLGDIISVVGAGMAGYLKGRDQKREQDQQDEDRQFQREQRDQTRAQWARDDQTRKDLAQAGQPETMQQFGGKPATMDDSDVGQPGEDAVAPNTFKVGDQSYDQQGLAQTALKTANTPQATMGRIADAYMKNGQAGMAAQVRSSAMQAQLAQLGLDKAQADAVSQAHDRKLIEAATTGGHEGNAKFITETAGDGYGGQLKAQWMPSQDGKTGQYQITKPDGTISVLPTVYTNDQAGAIRAAYDGSQGITLSDKLTHIQKDQELARQIAKDQSEATFQQGTLKNNADKVALLLQIQALKNQGRAAGGRASPAYDKMPEDQKLQYQNASKLEQELQAKIDAGMAGGTIDQNNPAFKYLTDRLMAAKQQRLGLEMRNGLRSPEDDAAAVMEGETDPANLTKSIAQAYAMGGKDWGDQFKAQVQPRIEALKKTAPPAAKTAGARAAPTKSATTDIPPPPSQFVQVAGTTGRAGASPNPDYAAWQQQYGAAWNAALAADKQAGYDAQAPAMGPMRAMAGKVR